MKNIIYILLFSILFFSCKKALDAYLGIPLQPKFDEDSFIPGLNIFGILRTDSTSTSNNSFIIVQKVQKAVGDSSGWEVDTATVWVSKVDVRPSDSICEFELSNDNNLFEETQYRPNCEFAPIPGEIYKLESIYEDLPVLTAHTIIPNKPQMVNNSASFLGNSLSFDIVEDTSYFMLDVYAYYNSEIIGFQRLPMVNNLNTTITLTNLPAKPDSIVAFGYDYNLAVYYLTSNTSLNFNKYRASFSTVDNGYGVFGSINKASIPLNN